MHNWNVPIYSSILKYSMSKPTVFHMPGHKLGAGLPKEFLDNLAQIDITEIPGSDNLHHPEGIIEEAQILAARVFGADKTFFLVNGSTCGIHAAVMTVSKIGDSLIVARDCHKSVINAMILAGVNPIYISPGFVKKFGITAAVTADDIEHAIDLNPDAVGVLITSPSYYGICADVEDIAKRVHKHGKVLIVDEAHGAHFGFDERLPKNAMHHGADISIQSAHKTLTAFTQAAYLHTKGNRIDIERLGFNLRMLQTSSPSYILMASLDLARAILEHEGKKLLERLINLTEEFKQKAKLLGNIKFLGKEEIDCAAFDPARLVINTRLLGLSGFQTEKILRNEFNIQIEMSDLFNIVCITAISDSKEAFDKLFDALGKLSVRFKNNAALADILIDNAYKPEIGIALKDIRNCKGEKINLLNAKGKISLDMITPYPPGIPLVCPGEIITDKMIENISKLISLGGIINGLTGNMEIYIIK